MKKVNGLRVLLGLCVLVCWNTWAVKAQSETDPRPSILIIGGKASASHRGAPSWVDLLRDQHPEWRILADAKSGRILGKTITMPRMKKGKQVGEIVYAGLEDELPGILDTAGPVDMVFIMIGTEMGRSVVAEQMGREKIHASLKATVAQLQSHPNAKQAQLVFATPVPVMESRLDQWSKEAFTGGEAIVKEIQTLIKQMPEQDGLAVKVVDVYQMVWDDKDGDKPARLLGSGGWYMRGWGHPILGRMLEKEFVALNPQASDPKAYQAWLDAREEFKKFNEVMISTGKGTVTLGPALAKVEPQQAEPEESKDKKKKKKKKGKYSGHHFTLPLDALSKESLGVMATAETGKLFSIVAPNSPDKAKFPVLAVTLDSGEVLKLTPKVTAMKILMEATPDRKVPNDFFGANIGKWRPYPLLSSVEGKRTWLLLRWDLSALEEKTVKAAEVIVHDSGRGGYTQMLNAQGAGARPDTKAGFAGPALYVIQSPDKDWSLFSATWKSKRNKIGWAGEAKDAAARKTALKKLLGEVKSQAVKAAIEAELAALK